MIDLSITKDPEWIKSREVVWNSLEEEFKEGLRKKELQELKTYFFTGVFPGQRDFADRAYFKWFPLQTPEGWNYVLQNLVKNEKVFEDSFYAALADLTGSGLSSAQELALWDYFAGDEFRPTVTSRVPVGKSANKVSLNVDIGNIAAEFKLFMDRWNSGSCEDEPKWKKRINYFIGFVESLPDASFLRREDGKPATREGRCIKMVFNAVCNPVYGDDDHILDGEKLEIRKKFTNYLFGVFDYMDMPSNMKSVWEEAKKR